ncbi:MAG TPA: Smr/MutS family protein [Fibrobacteria bacterium]|nr:Smr/MutS family protein [Fibrobacteria bacterium]HOX52158.1 Smr/MutS family protein [Fibrobacteria bacterium]
MNRAASSWFKPEATLDLHRLTVAEAEDALETFLHHNFRARKRTLLVIHGAKTLSGVVRRLLDSNSLVTGHEPDNPGATRVFLGRHP